MRGIGAALVAAGLAALPAAAMEVKTTTFKPNGMLDIAQVFKGFGCEGGNRSPALSWSGAPAATKSFAVTAYDPDAPTGSGWWHWLVINIPASVTALAENAGSGAGLPAGAVQTRTDFGAAGYGGPCPPKGHGTHRYIFTVHALSAEKIEVPAEASAALVGYMLNANILAKASVTGEYRRD
ncbi:MAG: YbhB/YbcL family Raf kinase inhibitor-like protein [Alphaproteobacteria bacterium]|nr:YbhB/YbcL family Raf kinase inhibitor-like protein [Alphaproteobacteria bacterium]